MLAAVGDVVDSVIPLVGGIFATLLGFGLIRKPGADPAREEKLRRVRRVLMVIGPLLIVISLVLMCHALGMY